MQLVKFTNVKGNTIYVNPHAVRYIEAFSDAVQISFENNTNVHVVQSIEDVKDALEEAYEV